MAGFGDVRLVGRAVQRKLVMARDRIPRLASRVRATREDYESRPPVVVTTVPKSGTHLVHQIVSTLPGVVDYGTFLATWVSYRRRPRSVDAQIRKVRQLAPGEILRSHIDHEPAIAAALREKGAFVVFVHRDPRDVALSEAHYLSDLAPWHTMHREFKKRTDTERIDLAIAGLPDDPQYPDVGARFACHAGWLEDADVVLRFEDLVDPSRLRPTVHDLVERYLKASGNTTDVEELTDRAIAAIDPNRSHTFREGRVGGWKTEMSAEQKEAFDSVAAEMLTRYGYRLTRDA